MLQSKLFSKIQRDFPHDEDSKNARLLTRGGFISKLSAGVYAYLPLGLRVLHKINDVVRGEMNALGSEEMLAPALVKKEYWEKSGRWNTPIMYKLDSELGEEVGLGWTHEEVMSAIASRYIFSYKDLPVSLYQIQTKFRAEPRARGGLIRNREFVMKDLYSFHADEKDLNRFYEDVIRAYRNVFKALNLPVKLTEASGGEFTKEFTHEFQLLNEAGEDTIFYCESCDFSRNKEVFEDHKGVACPKCHGKILSSLAIEVANIFKLGTRYSEKFDLSFSDKNGKKHPVVMGSYGIGQSRAMGVIAEVYGDDKGIVWPESVAPYKVHVIAVGKEKEVETAADKIYKNLEKKGVEVLYDDRQSSPGEKFSDADFIGIPWRVVVSARTMKENAIAVKKRGATEEKLMKEKDLEKILGI